MNPTCSFTRKFERRAPAHQNAVDIFDGGWATDLDPVCPGVRAGELPLFTADQRPSMLADRLGRGGRLDGMSVLELGPLEGAHAYQLEKLGAKSILAIEANVEAFLRCLIFKEICQLKVTRFMLGDFIEYLKETPAEYDVVMCSGVLYHQEDPISLIKAISRVTSKCFVWTHYFDENHYPGPPREIRFDPRYPDIKLYTLTYKEMDNERFWGGNQPISVWLGREDMLEAFKNAGFNSIEITEDTPNSTNGACFSFAAARA
jgi:hypothetical protein